MKIDPLFIRHLRTVAAPLLAAAVKSFCPKASLLGGGATSLGFYYDFVFPFPFQKTFLKEIEERMYALVVKEEPLKYLEMVPSCAEGYFLSKKEEALAEIAGSSLDSTVYLVDLFGKYYLLDEEVSIKDAGEIKGIKILKFEVLDQGVRIHGTAFPDKYELKKFLKERKDWIGTSHVDLGRELSLFSKTDEGGWIFSSKGKKTLEALIKKVETSLEEEGSEIIITHPSSDEKTPLERHQEAFKQLNSKWLSETGLVVSGHAKLFSSDLFDLFAYHSNFSHFFCKENLLSEEVISCLHFMTKIFKILDFEFHAVLIEKRKGRSGVLKQALGSVEECSGWTSEQEDYRGSRIEWRVRDRMGLEWPVSCLYAPRKVNKTGEFFCFPFSAVLSFERLFALLLERTKGSLPNWLASKGEEPN